ncbi:MAG: IgGFc-binding protein [Myxococcales bacterium]|nr:IgGFc-binding protein [Myxococcales bacterium]
MTTTDSSSSSTTGPMPICVPGETECTDNDSYQTCAGDGLSWEGPTDCPAKEVCSIGQCVSLCQQAKDNKSSIGCEYYAVDANNDPVENYDVQPYAVVVSNVGDIQASVQVQTHNGVDWQTLQMSNVDPGTLKQFDLPDRHVNYTAINPRGAYRVLSDVPIVAYQFQPINGQSSFTSDASLLLPVSVLDQYYYVVGWGEPSFGNAQINIVASEDDTMVTVTPKVNTVAGGGIPALTANQPYNLPLLKQADVVQIETSQNVQSGFSGTYITSDKPIAVFSTHWCANLPQQNCCCDHLEEQLYGLQTWGTSYVASRWPVRNQTGVEPSIWHVIASEDNTAVHIDAHAEVTGIAQKDFVLNKGQVQLLQVGGTTANPGDFFIDADKPIALMQYLSTSQSTNAPTNKAGDPAMAQGVPSEQFRDEYVILVPSNWVYDYLVLTKKSGATINIDGAMVDQNNFVKVGSTEWEVARVSIPDGVHNLDGSQPFSVIVMGLDSYDSYAYPGGLDQKVINPQ